MIADRHLGCAIISQPCQEIKLFFLCLQVADQENTLVMPMARKHFSNYGRQSVLSEQKKQDPTIRQLEKTTF